MMVLFTKQLTMEALRVRLMCGNSYTFTFLWAKHPLTEGHDVSKCGSDQITLKLNSQLTVTG